MSVATPTRDNPGTRGIVIGLIALGGFVAFVTVVTFAVLGGLLATGTLRHTSQGWAFQAPANSTAARELRSAKLDTAADTLVVGQGSGSGQTVQFTTVGPWIADWAYSCSSDASSFRVLAQGSNQSYPAGALSNIGSGAGNSNKLAAGTYVLKVTTDPGCNWTVGARPSH